MISMGSDMGCRWRLLTGFGQELRMGTFDGEVVRDLVKKVVCRSVGEVEEFS